MQEAFKVFDQDGGGTISPEELSAILLNVGEPVTMDDVKALIDAIDEDGDGEIDLVEFSEFVVNGSKKGAGGGGGGGGAEAPAVATAEHIAMDGDVKLGALEEEDP